MNDVFNEPQITLAYTDSQADKGYFVYRIFNTTFTGTNVTVRVFFYDGLTGTGAAPGYFPLAAQWDNIAITKAANFTAPQASGSTANPPSAGANHQPDQWRLRLRLPNGCSRSPLTQRSGWQRHERSNSLPARPKLEKAQQVPGPALWTNAVSGSYVLTAMATDNMGATTLSAPVSVVVVVPFTTTDALSGARAGHSATLLPSGRVLVVGGFNGAVRLPSSELYNPAGRRVDGQRRDGCRADYADGDIVVQWESTGHGGQCQLRRLHLHLRVV